MASKEKELFFPDNFFEDEVRDGFYVPSMMKRVWATQLKMLKALEDLFDRYGIVYYADYGTLLGAVRHGGFIPWDDDIDITMTRRDFMTFIAHADELPEPYRLLSVYSSDSFYNFHAVLSNSRAPKLEWDEKRRQNFFGCPYIVNIDIYPLDYVPRDEAAANLQKLTYTMVYGLVHRFVELEDRSAKGETIGEEELDAFQNDLESALSQIARVYGASVSIDDNRPLRNALCRLAEQIASRCEEKDADMMDYYAHMAFSATPILREKRCYAHAVELPFESTTIKVPWIYSAVLKKRFGPGYMQPVQELAAHDYPFYRKQEEYFRYTGDMA